MREQLLDRAAEKLEVAREDLELVGGRIQVVGSPARWSRSPSSPATAGRSSARAPGPCPENPPCEAQGCLGRLGMESFLEPQVFTHAARVKVDRETGVVRVLQVAAAHDSGVIINRIGATGQVYGGIVMGIGQALLEASMLDEDGRQRNPHLLDYKLVTAVRRSAHRRRLDRDAGRERRPEGLQGRRRASDRPDSRGDRERDRQGRGRARARAPDDPRAGLGRGGRAGSS